ncbi:hypothetical protein Esti_004177 [Eimeria stiedai]
MKNYFRKPRASCCFWGEEAPWGVGVPAAGTPAAAAAAAAGVETLQQQQQQLAVASVISKLVEAERQAYQQRIKRSSRRTYCVVCEEACVSPPALRCTRCAADTTAEGGDIFALLPDAFNPNRRETGEGDSSSSSSRSPALEGTPEAAAANEALFLKLFGVGVEKDRTDLEPDLRPALWCHQKHCKQDLDLKGLLICSNCRRAFHAGCCDPPLNFEMVTRFPWQCADCKICEACFSNTNEERMLICDACDRAFHMECLDPPVDEVPDGDWFCKGCGYCSCCRRQLTEEEALDPTCFYSNRNRICPGCRVRHLRLKRGRALGQPDALSDSLYFVFSSLHASPPLCEVCAAPFDADNRGPSRRVFCVDCKIRGLGIVALKAPEWSK